MFFATRKRRREEGGAARPPHVSASSPSPPRPKKRKKERARKETSPSPSPGRERRRRRSPIGSTRQGVEKSNKLSFASPLSSPSPASQSPVIIDLCSDDEEGREERWPLQAATNAREESSSPSSSASLLERRKASSFLAGNVRRGLGIADAHGDQPDEDGDEAPAAFPAYATSAAVQRGVSHADATSVGAWGTEPASLSSRAASFRRISQPGRADAQELSVSSSMSLFHQALGERPAAPTSFPFSASAPKNGSLQTLPSAAEVAEGRSEGSLKPKWLTVGRSFDVSLLGGRGDRSLGATAGVPSGPRLERGRDEAAASLRPISGSAVRREEEERKRKNAEEKSLLEVKCLLGRDEETVKRRSRRQERGDMTAFEDADFDSLMPPPSSIFSAEDFDQLMGFSHPTTVFSSQREHKKSAGRGPETPCEGPEDDEEEHLTARPGPRLAEVEKRQTKNERRKLLPSGLLHDSPRRREKRGNETEGEEEGPVLRLLSFTLTDYKVQPDSLKKRAKETRVKESHQASDEAKRPEIQARDDGLPFYERIPFVVGRSSTSSTVLARLSRATGRPTLWNFSHLSSSFPSPSILLPTLRHVSASGPPLPGGRPAAKASGERGDRARAQGGDDAAGLYTVGVTFDVEGATLSGENEKTLRREHPAVQAPSVAGGEMEVALQVHQFRQRLGLRCRRGPGDAANWMSLVSFEPLFLFFSKSRRSTTSFSETAAHRQLALLSRARREAPDSLQLLFLSLFLSSLYDEPAHALFLWRRALLDLPGKRQESRPVQTPDTVPANRRVATGESSAGFSPGAAEDGARSAAAAQAERGSGVPAWASSDLWEGRLWLEHFFSAVGIFDCFSVSASRALAGDLVELLAQRAARREAAGSKARKTSDAEPRQTPAAERGADFSAEDARLQVLLGGLVPCEIRGGHHGFVVRLLQAFLHAEVYAASLGPGGRMLGMQQLELAFASPHNLHFGDPCAGYLLHSTLQLASMMRPASSLASAPLEAKTDEAADGLRLCEAVDEWVKSERRRVCEAHVSAFSFLDEERRRRAKAASRRLLPARPSCSRAELTEDPDKLLALFLHHTERATTTAALFDWFLAAEEASETLAWWADDAGEADAEQDAEQTPECEDALASDPHNATESLAFSSASPWTSRGRSRAPAVGELLTRLCLPAEARSVADERDSERSGEEGREDWQRDERRKQEQRDRLLAGLDALASPSVHRFCSNDPRAARAIEGAADARLLFTVSLLSVPSKFGSPSPGGSWSPVAPSPQGVAGSPSRAAAHEAESRDRSSRLVQFEDPDSAERAAPPEGKLEEKEKPKKKRSREGHPGALFGSWWPDRTFVEDSARSSLAATLSGLWKGVEAQLSDSVARLARTKQEAIGERRRREEEAEEPDEGGRQKSGEGPGDGGRTHDRGGGAGRGGDREREPSLPHDLSIEDETKKMKEARTRAQLIGLLSSQALLCLPGDPLVAYCVMAACRNPKVTKAVLRLFPSCPGLWLAYASSLYHEAFQQHPGARLFSSSAPSPCSASVPSSERCRGAQSGDAKTKENRCALASARNVMFTCCSAFSHHLPLAASWAHLEIVSQKAPDFSLPPPWPLPVGADSPLSSLSPQEVLVLHDACRAPLDRSLPALCWLSPLFASPASLRAPCLLPWEGAGLSERAVGVACCAAEGNFDDLSPRAAGLPAEPPLKARGNREREEERERPPALSFLDRKRLIAAKRRLTEKLNALARDKFAAVPPRQEQEFPLLSSPLYSCIFLLSILSAALSPASPSVAAWRVLSGSALPRLLSYLPRQRAPEGWHPSGGLGEEKGAHLGEVPRDCHFLAGVSERNVTGACTAAEAGPQLSGEEARCVELLFTFLLSLLVALGRSPLRLAVSTESREKAGRGEGEAEGHFRRRHTDALDVRHRLLHLLRVPFFGILSSPWPRVWSPKREEEKASKHVASGSGTAPSTAALASVCANAGAPEEARKESRDARRAETRVGQGEAGKETKWSLRDGGTGNAAKTEMTERRNNATGEGGASDTETARKIGETDGAEASATRATRAREQAGNVETREGEGGEMPAEAEGDEEGCVDIEHTFCAEETDLEITAEGAFSLAMLEAFVLAEILAGAPSLKLLTSAFEFAFHDAQLSIAYGASPSRFFSRWSPTSSLAKEGIFFMYAHVLLLFLRDFSADEGGEAASSSQARGVVGSSLLKTPGAGRRTETGAQRKRRKALERDLDRVLLRGITQCPYSKSTSQLPSCLTDPVFLLLSLAAFFLPGASSSRRLPCFSWCPSPLRVSPLALLNEQTAHVCPFCRPSLLRFASTLAVTLLILWGLSVLGSRGLPWQAVAVASSSAGQGALCPPHCLGSRRSLFFLLFPDWRIIKESAATHPPAFCDVALAVQLEGPAEHGAGG
ncbi:conserved hypothetical protein [Neospora caninum Liverpool]|uniref:Uncharacterized protein n=1 Tax=Neospora caninum (strain Liverpool) TaxID=572307 RepID=F0V9A4_NEOCL|nr:conserved hypothetical protein [Neospora caninum Liverpool]CBZ50329.1 conserved hypothetical protein [Neospora caninum Liverpool]|eukprot:XP_003880363.1 conserved hypothetical protein [Neospora caninum Liverpool]